MTLLVHFYVVQILPEPEVVRLSVYHIKKLALVSSFKNTYFHSDRIISCKDIAVYAISRIMRIFPEPEVLSQKFEKSFLLFTSYTSCANFSSVALIAASES